MTKENTTMLERYAKRKTRKGTLTKTLTARIDSDVYEDFKNYCEGLGLSVSEGVNLLIHEELRYVVMGISGIEHTENTFEYKEEDKGPTFTFIPPSKKHTDVVKQNTNEHQEEDNTHTDVFNLEYNSNTDRFTTKPYERNGNLYCPICGEWKSAKNFSRHAKEQHNTSTKSIYTNPLYLESIANMLGK
jgi:antitoxin component of RelBE/YafQ-DinJ toxin-antitoxin module